MILFILSLTYDTYLLRLLTFILLDTYDHPGAYLFVLLED